MGSVKELVDIIKPTHNSAGEGYFVFGDGFSVKDWKRFKDQVPGKGMSLCLFGAKTFELIEESGMPTHYIGLIDEGGNTVKLNELETPTNRMKVQTVNTSKLKPRKVGGKLQYDYKAYNSETNVCVDPLEWIVRYTASKGSSVRRRYHDPRVLGLPYDKWPDQTVKLDKPWVECSTKFEPEDRYLRDEDALNITGFSEDQFKQIKRDTLRIGDIITEQCKKVGFEHEDGKIEWVRINGEAFVGDVAGTPDENRFTKAGKPFSKEILRQYYKKYQTAWCNYADAAKKLAEDEGIEDWRDLCLKEPKAADEDLLNLVGEAYQAGANLYTEKKFFDVRPLDVVLGSIYSKFDV